MKANWKGIELDARAKKPLSMQEAMDEVQKARATGWWSAYHTAILIPPVPFRR